MPQFLGIVTWVPATLSCDLSDWYGSYTTSVATSGTSSVITAQSNQTAPAVTVSLELAVSSAANVSQSAEGSTATPAAVTHTVSSSTPRVSASDVPPANGANSTSVSAPPRVRTSQKTVVYLFLR